MTTLGGIVDGLMSAQNDQHHYDCIPMKDERKR